jgi:hypothetical protein
MKRVGSTAILLFAAFGLTACQNQTPTAPSAAAGNAPASGVLHDDDGGYSSDSSLSARLTASPSTINAGQSSTLTWSSQDAEHVYLDGNEVSRSGSKTVSPSATKTYTLVAVHDDHRVSSSATVTVSGSGSSSDDGDLRARLTATPTTIQAGQSSTLTWTSDDAEHVYLDGVEVVRDGSKSVSPSATKTYTLVAVHDDHRVSSSATVTVSSTTPPVSMPTASLTPRSATIQSGQSITLTWATTNATSATVNGATVALNGSQAYSPTVTTTYTLVATNSAGSATSTATVTVSATPPPLPMPTALLTAMPTTIQSGQSTTLQWATSNATTITLDGSAVNANGSRVMSPTATTTYTLVATNATGSVQSMATVTVTAPPVPMPTALLTAMPTTIQSGQSTTLQWATSNATTITLDGSAVNASGSRSVSPMATTTYTLVASNASGSVQSTATVTVTAPPPPPGLTYVADVKPILDSNCIMCHGGSQPTAGLDLSTYRGVMTVATPGDPNSRIIQMTRTGGAMHGYLNPDPAGRADTIYRWIVNFGAAQQ